MVVVQLFLFNVRFDAYKCLAWCVKHYMGNIFDIPIITNVATVRTSRSCPAILTGPLQVPKKTFLHKNIQMQQY